MLDGHERVQIACGKLRWEGAIQHAGRTRNRANSIAESFTGRERYSMLDGHETVESSLRKASPGGSDTACWTDTKPCKYSLRKASLGWSETACWTDMKPCK